MQLSTIRYFLEVARLGSIRIAAERLNIVPSAVSRQISQLEAELGETLLERHARGVRLTQAGLVVYENAKQILSNVDNIQDQLDELKGLHRGTVRLCAIEGAISQIALDAVAEIHGEYPNIKFHVSIAGSYDSVNLVLDSEYDIFISFNAIHKKGIDILFSSEQTLHTICCPGHELVEKGEFSLYDIQDHAVAYPDESFGIRPLLDQALGRINRYPDPVIVSDSLEGLKAFARKGLGITFLPRLAVARDLELGELAQVPIKEAELVTSDVIIGVREGRTLPRHVQKVSDVLCAKITAYLD